MFFGIKSNACYRHITVFPYTQALLKAHLYLYIRCFKNSQLLYLYSYLKLIFGVFPLKKFAVLLLTRKLAEFKIVSVRTKAYL